MSTRTNTDDVENNDGASATGNEGNRGDARETLWKIIAAAGWVVALIFAYLYVHYIWMQNGRLATGNAVLKESVDSLAESYCFQKCAKLINESTNSDPIIELPTTIEPEENGPQTSGTAGTLPSSSSTITETNPNMKSSIVGPPEKAKTNPNKPNDEGLKQQTKKDKRKGSDDVNALGPLQ